MGRASGTDEGVLVGGVKSCDHGYLVYPRYPDLLMLGWSIQKRALDYLQEWPIKTWTSRVERVDGVNDLRWVWCLVLPVAEIPGYRLLGKAERTHC